MPLQSKISWGYKLGTCPKDKGHGSVLGLFHCWRNGAEKGSVRPLATRVHSVYVRVLDREYEEYTASPSERPVNKPSQTHSAITIWLHNWNTGGLNSTERQAGLNLPFQWQASRQSD